MTRLLLVRHGESEFNNTRRFAGQVDIDLTTTGLHQVELLRDRLAGEKIDAVYTSNLKRARQTAEIAISGRNLTIVECPELAEISYGEIEGLTYPEIQQRYPELAVQIRHSDLSMTFPGGESFLEFIKRVESFKERLTNHNDSESVLIVAHGGPLRTLLLSLLGIDQTYWWQLRVDNASLTVVDTYPGTENPHSSSENKTGQVNPPRVILSLFNETSYLTEKTGYQPPPQHKLQQQSQEKDTAKLSPDLVIRPFAGNDISTIYNTYKTAGWYMTKEKLEGYIAEQENGKRSVLVAYTAGRFAGIVTVKWQAEYQPFAEKGIPIIEDLSVIPFFHRQGIATRLVDKAEQLIFQRSPMAGISVGLYADYGAAQRMYMQRGYVPDGLGVSYNGQPLKPNSEVRLDENFILYLTRANPGTGQIISPVRSPAEQWFEDIKNELENAYLQYSEPWKQSGLMISDPAAWTACRKPIADSVDKPGTFLDIGCANGYLLETVLGWTRKRGISLVPFGLDLSEKLVSLAKERLPDFQDNFFIENAFYWKNPPRFDYVHSELVYVPDQLHRQFLEKLLYSYLKPDGRLLLSEYRSRKAPPEKPWLESTLAEWGFRIERVVPGFYDGKEVIRVYVIPPAVIY